MRACDLFGKPINLRFEGSSNYKTLPGTFCSLFFVLIVCLFALNKYIIMLYFDDSHLTTSVIKDGIPADAVLYTSETNLTIAFGLTSS